MLEGHSKPVLIVAFSPDRKRVESSSNDHIVRFWDIMTGVALHTLKGHSNVVIVVAFSPDGKHVASGSQDQIVRIWDGLNAIVL